MILIKRSEHSGGVVTIPSPTVILHVAPLITLFFPVIQNIALTQQPLMMQGTSCEICDGVYGTYISLFVLSS